MKTEQQITTRIAELKERLRQTYMQARNFEKQCNYLNAADAFSDVHKLQFIIAQLEWVLANDV